MANVPGPVTVPLPAGANNEKVILHARLATADGRATDQAAIVTAGS